VPENTRRRILHAACVVNGDAGCMQVDNTGEELVSPSTGNHSKSVWREGVQHVRSGYRPQSDGSMLAKVSTGIRLLSFQRTIDRCRDASQWASMDERISSGGVRIAVAR
jgi:hypothetical protein